MQLKEFKKAVDDYEKYLDLTAVRTCEHPHCDSCELVSGRRAYAHIGIAQAKHLLGWAPNVIVDHFLKSAAECPRLREAWTYLADGFFATGNYPAAYGAAMTALTITDNGLHSMDMRCWGNFPKELADNAFARILAGNTDAQTAPTSYQTQSPTSSSDTRAHVTPNYRMGQSISDEFLATYFSDLVKRTENIKGDIIECGVCHGYSFTQIALALYKSGKKKKLYGLDVWDIMPEPGPEDASIARTQGISEELARFDVEGSQGSPEEVLKRLTDAGIPKKWVDKNVVLIKGDIKKTLLKLKENKFALVHLDVDTYSSYVSALNLLWPILIAGGVMAFDEYGDPWWPGASKAIDEYFMSRKENFNFEECRVGHTIRHFVVKSPGNKK